MMERYTIEDIEIIRRKSGISYEEAVNLLEYHNGNLAKALIDLERSGKLNESKGQQTHYDHRTGKEKAMNILQKLYSKRFVVKKGKTDIINISLLFMIPFAFFFPYVAVIALVLIFVMGYRIRIVNSAEQFKDVEFDKVVKNAAQNVKDTFSDLTGELGFESKKAASEPTEDSRSYYRPTDQASAPAQQTASMPQVPTMPVIVNCSEDGSVKVTEDKDGFSQATIE